MSFINIFFSFCRTSFYKFILKLGVVMAGKLKAFLGFLLVAIGIAVLILGFIHRFKNLIMVLASLTVLVGLGVILSSRRNNVVSFADEKKVLKDSSDSKLDKLKNIEVKGLSQDSQTRNLDEMKSFEFDSLDPEPDSMTKELNELYKFENYDKPPKKLHKVEHDNSKFTDKTYQFTPNYERPLKITRKPSKKQTIKNKLFNISNIPKSEKSKRIEEELGNNSDKKVISSLYPKNDDTSMEEDLHSDHPHNKVQISGGKSLENTDILTNNNPNKFVNEDLDSQTHSLSSAKDLLGTQEDKEIIIDPNNPESIPIPKILKSYVIGPNGRLSTQEAFDDLSAEAKFEVCLITNSLKDLSHKFLKNISHIHTKIIIEEMNLSDLSEALIVSSMINKNIEIRTMPKLNTINLIIDDGYALIVSSSEEFESTQYGAIYTDYDSIDDVKKLFYSTWELAEKIHSIELMTS